MMTSHPQHYPPPRPTSAAGAVGQDSPIGATRGGVAESVSDGRMGRGAFNETMRTPERSNTTSLSLAPPPRSHLKSSPPSLFPSFADFVPRLQDIKRGRGRGECSWQDQETPELKSRVNAEEVTSPLVGRHARSTTQIPSPFSFDPFDSPQTPLREPMWTSDSFVFNSDWARSPSNMEQFAPPEAEPLTPPHTPFRSASMPRHRPRHPHHAMHSLPPSPPPSHYSPLHEALPRQPMYPLSEAETETIAHLHNGRVPSLQQLAPRSDSDEQAPIVNTGNQGPMIVQQGDWSCGVCAFVNWRRRKICLRCFPYANDIGNILTINSQRAASLAASVVHPPKPPTPIAFTRPAPLPPQQQNLYLQEEHVFPAPFQHVRSSSLNRQPAAPPPPPPARPALHHYATAPALTRFPGLGVGDYERLRKEHGTPEVIWTSSFSAMKARPREGEGLDAGAREYCS